MFILKCRQLKIIRFMYLQLSLVLYHSIHNDCLTFCKTIYTIEHFALARWVNLQREGDFLPAHNIAILLIPSIGNAHFLNFQSSG